MSRVIKNCGSSSGDAPTSALRLCANLVLLPLVFLAGFASAAETPPVKPENPASKPARFITRLQKGEPVQIVTLGTSLTGGGWPWVTVMKEWLEKDFPGLVTIHNLGVGASASSYPPGRGGLDTVKRCARLKPDVVFIEFAVNDAFLPYKISLEDSRRNLNTMVDVVRQANPKAEIVVQTMDAVLNMPGAPIQDASLRPRLADYYQGCREVARERGLILIDNYPNWLKLLKSGRDEYLRRVPDGIHPREPGYREVLLPELKRVLLGQT
jgi:acyl-CoA thioesterase I